jgi:hypothetical protein
MAQISVGVDPVKVQFQLPPWQRIRQKLSRKQPAQFVKAYPLQARISIPAADEGSAELLFLLINHLPRSVYPDRVEVQQWTTSSWLLPELPFTGRGLGHEVPRHSETTYSIACQLNAAAIKRFLQSVPNDPFQVVAGHYMLNVQLSIHFRGSKHPIGFSLQYSHPHMNFYWLGPGTRNDGAA